MNEEKYQIAVDLNQDIIDIIEEYQLMIPKRNPEIAFKRYFLYNFLQKRRHLSTTMIGRMFGKNHASVIHGIREHEYWWKRKDPYYLRAVYPLPELITHRREDVNSYDVKVMHLDDQEVKVTITGVFSPKMLTSIEQVMQREEIGRIFTPS
jgi:hypothetical protein